MNPRVPNIAAIQRTTFVLVITVAGLIALLASTSGALGCLIGGALMIVNLSVLTLIGQAIVAVARRDGGATAIGLIAAPVKMLFLAAIVYFVVVVGRVNIAGFIVGSLTQFAAIFIEVWRASRAGPHRPFERRGNQSEIEAL